MKLIFDQKLLHKNQRFTNGAATLGKMTLSLTSFNINEMHIIYIQREREGATTKVHIFT